jgi:mannosyltransferase OCH1-like enzyme
MSTTTETVTTTVDKITRVTGIAGQFAYTARVTHTGDDWTDTGETTFVGSEYGNPGSVVAITGGGLQFFVQDPSQYGPKLNPEWIRNYFRA